MQETVLATLPFLYAERLKWGSIFAFSQTANISIKETKKVVIYNMELDEKYNLFVCVGQRLL